MTKKLALDGGEKSISVGEIPIDQHTYRKEDLEKIRGVLESRRYSMFNNSINKDFEKEIAKLVGTKSAAAVTNCTGALDASLRALKMNPGDEVIMPSYTYAATMMAILSAGAKPVFVDIDYNTLTIDSSKIEEKITSKTRAIMPVHIFGNPCKMDDIVRIAKRNNLRVVEDCAHSLGAMYGGKMTGSFDIGCHSFGENKILRLGEGGAITSNPNFIKKIEIIRHEGEVWDRTKTSGASGIDFHLSDFVNGMDYVAPGHNFRYSPILSALGLSKLEVLPKHISAMNNNGKAYSKRLKNIPNLIVPKSFPKSERIYSSFIVLTDGVDRNTLLLALAMEGVPVGLHFPKPLHHTQIYKTFCRKEKFPAAEKFCKNHLALPVYPSIGNNHVGKICDVLEYVIEEIKKNPSDLKRKTHEKITKIPVKKFYSGVYVTV